EEFPAMAKVKDNCEKPPFLPKARYPDGTYRMPSRALNGGQPWYPYRVRDGDSWVSLAAADEWTNVWDLITANFDTHIPEEVNWYLREYVGCDVITTDQSNYRFSSSAKPGFIWTRTPLDTKHIVNLPQLVLDALNFSAFPLFDFRLGTSTIEPWLFPRVRSYVSKGLIRVQHSPGLPADGEYVSSENTLHLKSTGRDPNNKALIVHECVHAGMDLKGHNTMKKAVSEA